MTKNLKIRDYNVIFERDGQVIHKMVVPAFSSIEAGEIARTHRKTDPKLKSSSFKVLTSHLKQGPKTDRPVNLNILFNAFLDKINGRAFNSPDKLKEQLNLALKETNLILVQGPKKGK